MIFIMIDFKKKHANYNLFQCYVCGKFMNSENMLTSYTPDSKLTTEKIYYYHTKCKNDFHAYASI